MGSKAKQAEGVMTLAEMKEFASFGAATQRYIRRALDIGLDRDDAMGRWSRDVVEAANIRAQARHYQALPALRRAVAAITSAGTGYTSAPTITLVGGGATTAATLGAVTTATITANDGGLTKLGTGVLTLTGANTYTGATQVNAGTLLANNTSLSLTNSATGLGNVTVGNAAGTLTATLGGTGTMLGNVTVNPGSVITGGTVGTVGTLTAFSNLTLAGTAAAPANFTVNISGARADQLTISGILSLTNASITFVGTPTASSYVLATYASETGTFSGSVPAGYQLSFNPNGTELDLVAVPEPSAWMGVVAFGGLLGLVRRRQFSAWLRLARR